MATTKNTDNTPTILVPVLRGEGGAVDIKKFVREAEKMIEEYAKQDEAATQAVVEVADKILSDERWSKHTDFTSGSFARLALAVMDEFPSDKLLAETEVRAKAYLLSQPEKFLFIPRGRNSGFHIRERIKADDLAKLEKEAANAAEKAAAK